MSSVAFYEQNNMGKVPAVKDHCFLNGVEKQPLCKEGLRPAVCVSQIPNALVSPSGRKKVGQSADLLAMINRRC